MTGIHFPPLSVTFSLLLFTFSLLSSCTEDYQLPGTGQQTTMVITGLITNEQGPYYVNIMECVSDMATGNITLRGVNDARVTITDDSGTIAEVLPFISAELDSVETGRGNIIGTGEPYVYYRYFLLIPNYDGGYDTCFLKSENYRPGKRYDLPEGQYFTTAVRGVPGRTYTLKVEYNGKVYTATDRMPYGTVLDSISVEPSGRYIYDKPDGTDGFMVPCLYFAEPQNEVNFYMFRQSFTGKFISEQEKFEIKLEPVKNVVLSDWLKAESDFLSLKI